MEKIEINVMEITCDTGLGVREEQHIAYINCSELEAAALASDLSRLKRWPYSARRYKKKYSFFESVEEFEEANSEIGRKKLQITNLEETIKQLKKEIEELK